MSSPAHGFQESSPAGAPGCRRSRFTYRQLSQLASYSTTNPLRVVAHVDLDAFYAQCEMVRLGVSEEQPLAVQQWQGLIAVNYPARAHGIGRHCDVTEAKKLCPDLITQHVATWREGEDTWAYHGDAAENIATDKVSLDPYRLESRKILALIKESLPPTLQKVEKAGIDEVFLDLSAHVHSILLERFEELTQPPPYDDPSEKLPMPSISALDWKADALVDLVHEDEEIDDPDWDDVATLIGSEIVRNVRAAIREKIGYTCSAGIANNKMVSKLGSGFKKPNQQTVIRTRAVQHFLSSFKVTKIRNLGGKLGDQIVQLFQSDAVTDLLLVSLEQLKSKLGDDTGIWVHNYIRGIDTSEVNSRVQIKSMLSAKSFRPNINTFEQAVRWLRIFAADIFSRLVEEGILENKRRPKTINLHHRHGAQTRSRQGPIAQGRPLDETGLFDLARNLLSQIVAEGNVWPCANLSLSVGGFEDGVTGNMGIGSFLLKGEAAQALKAGSREGSQPEYERQDRRMAKRRRVEDVGIQRFLVKQSSEGSDRELGSDDVSPMDDGDIEFPAVAGGTDVASCGVQADQHEARNQQITAYACSRCNVGFETAAEDQSHKDWHYAKDLQDREERASLAFANRPSASATASASASTHTPGNISRKGAAASPKRAGRPRKTEPGQSKLKFG